MIINPHLFIHAFIHTFENLEDQVLTFHLAFWWQIHVCTLLEIYFPSAIICELQIFLKVALNPHKMITYLSQSPPFEHPWSTSHGITEHGFFVKWSFSVKQLKKKLLPPQQMEHQKFNTNQLNWFYRISAFDVLCLCCVWFTTKLR